MKARPRRWLRRGVMVLLAMTVLHVAGPEPVSLPQVVEASAVSVLEGEGITGAACFACAVLIFGAGYATIGGALLVWLFYPELVAACGLACIKALL